MGSFSKNRETGIWSCSICSKEMSEAEMKIEMRPYNYFSGNEKDMHKC